MIHADNYADSLRRVDAEELMEFPIPSKRERDVDIEEDSLDEREDFIEKELIELAAVNASVPYSSNKKPFVPSDNRQSKQQDTVNGCFGMLLHNECKSKGPCAYSHDRAMLCRTHAYLTKLLHESQYKSSSSFSAPRAIIPNDERKQQHRFSELNNMSVTMTNNSHLYAAASSDDNDNVYDGQMTDFKDKHDPQLCELLRTMIFSAVPEASLYSAMHREGEINVSSTDCF